MSPAHGVTLLACACTLAASVQQSIATEARRGTVVTQTSPTVLAKGAETPAEAAAVVAFWRDVGPALWFAKDAAFDHRFRERFLALHEQAARGALDRWRETADGAMALVILLDQFPRNAFRATSRMYATDERARHLAHAAIAAGHDAAFEPALRVFLYLPFGHSESLADQDRSVALCEPLGEPTLTHAKHHREIIRRFGRFPHRNPILGRTMTAEEQRYLDEGGFAG
jgi:uncharacterized protein (DUF924 family)